MLAPLIRPGGRCLDIGAGMGFLVDWLLHNGWSDVTALDTSEYAVRKLKERCPAARVILSNAENSLPLEGRFDTITLVHVLEHTKSPADLLRHLDDLLSPDGVALVVVPNCGPCWQHWIGNPQWGRNDSTHVNFFTLKSLKELMQTTFEETRCFTYAVPGLWALSPWLARRLAFGLGNHIVAAGWRKRAT
ncbi:MAG: class I SAM-dependent methyltransferase [FCB group bacterium]|nr:class I SAM-dependent methyltransferase [FCB group bacterium]